MKTRSGRYVVLGLAVSLLALLGAVAQPTSAAAEPDPALVPTLVAAPIVDVAVTTLEVGTVVVDEGTETAIVPLVINPGPTSVAAFQIELTFDAEALTPTGCSHLSGFGVCAPQGDGRLELNAARIESWTTRTEVIEIAFTVHDTSAIRVGEVAGVWGDETSGMQKIAYDLVFGSVQVGENETATSGQRPGAALDGDAALTGTASAGVQSSGLFGAGICAMHEESHAARCTVTNSRGEYRIDGLPAGVYTVEYVGVDTDEPTRRVHGVVVDANTIAQGVDFDLSEQGDIPEIDVVEETDSVAVHEAQAADGVASLQDELDNGVIDGALTDANGDPVAAAWVCAYEVGIGTELCDASGFDGTYRIEGLLPGNYTVSITDPGQRFEDEATRTFGYNARVAKQLDFELTSR